MDETHDDNPLLYRGIDYEVVRRGRRYFVKNRDTGYVYGGTLGWTNLQEVNRAVRVWDDDHRRRMITMAPNQ